MEYLPVIVGILLAFAFVGYAEGCGKKTSNQPTGDQPDLTVEEKRRRSYQGLLGFIARHPESAEELTAQWDCSQEIEDRLREEVFPHCVTASPVQYARWVQGYLAKGGKITHYQDFDFPTNQFHFVKEHCGIMKLFGPAPSFIVPTDVTVEAVDGEFGSINFYYMKDFSCSKDEVVPLYADVAQLLDSFECKGDHHYELEYLREVEKAAVSWDEEISTCYPTYERKERKRKIFLLSNCSPATSVQYEQWLQGYLVRGGENTHPQSHKFAADEFFIVNNDCIIPSLQGSYDSPTISLIIPNGITVKAPHSALMHCNVYYMEDYSYKGCNIGNL